MFFFECYSEKIDIRGISDSEITSIIKSNKLLFILDAETSEDSISNAYKIKHDVENLKDVLYSFGYFDAEITTRNEKEKKVIFDVKLNERYRLNDVSIRCVDYPDYSSGIKVYELFDLIHIKIDSYTNTSRISDAVSILKEFYKKQSFAFVDIKTPRLEIDRKNKKFKAIFDVYLNRKIIIDHTNIVVKSLPRDGKLLDNFVRNRVRWNDGDLYNSETIENTRDDISISGIFASVEIKLSTPVLDGVDKNKAHVNIDVIVEEAKLHDVSAGLKYGTTDKLGVQFSYTHYNIDGKGARFSSITDLSKAKNSETLQYMIPDVFCKRQELKNQLSVSKENVTAYDVKKICAESILWHEIFRNTKVGVGTCFETSKTKDNVIENSEYQKFDAVGIPVGFNIDTTKVYLDPQSGVRCSVTAIPYMCKQNFTSLNGKCSFYFPLSRNEYDNKVVIACYTRIGSIINSKKNILPKDKLFFAGGINSVRAYDYQMLGELNSDNKPKGGESVFEIGVEPRVKISEKVGVVVFVEGGNVYETRIPKFCGKLLWGCGFGVRYYTPLGPIRFDVAFPFSRRRDNKNKAVDSMFNIYISIGQAF